MASTKTTSRSGLTPEELVGFEIPNIRTRLGIQPATTDIFGNTRGDGLIWKGRSCENVCME